MPGYFTMVVKKCTVMIFDLLNVKYADGSHSFLHIRECSFAEVSTPIKPITMVLRQPIVAERGISTS